MKRNEDTLFSKSTINFQLEKVMDSKYFSDEVKSLILNIVYKIDNSYKDYSKLKYNVKTKEEIITDITNILNNDCEVIEIDKTNNTNDRYYVNEKEKIIKVFPSEVPMISALFYIKRQNNKKSKNLLNKAFNDAIRIGYSINGAEVIRDFNGWSWTGSIENNKSKLYNLLYQNMLILVGVYKLEEIYNSGNSRPYLARVLSNIYGEKKSDEIIKKIDVCCLLLYAEKGISEQNEILEYYNGLKKKFKIINNKPEYISIIARKNKSKMKTVNFIENVLKDKTLLEKKYLRPGIKEKYGYLENYRAHLIRIQKKKLKEIEKNSSMINPFEYIKKKEEISKDINSFEYYEKNSKIENPFYEGFLMLQRSIISCFYKKMEVSELRKELLNIVYEIRYLNYIQVKDNMLIKDVKELEVDIRNIQKHLISKLYAIKALDVFSNDENVNYNIMKHLFLTKSINMNKLYAKLSYNNNKLLIEYYDEDTLDGKNSIDFSKDDFKELVKKTNKKIKLLI